jgi:hypothetical protein
MFLRRTRPLARAAMAGGAAPYAKKNVEQGRGADVPTEEGFNQQKQRLLQGT